MIKIIGSRDKPDASAINTTSHSANDWSSGLSPFKLGPLCLYDNHTAQIFENAWQFAKLYPEHTDFQGQPTTAYWNWARRGWNSQRAYRYPWANDGNLSAHSGMVKDLTISPLANKSTCRFTRRPSPRLTLITDLKKPTGETDRSLCLISMAMITPA
jgi:hypothetical protein